MKIDIFSLYQNKESYLTEFVWILTCLESKLVNSDSNVRFAAVGIAL